MTTSLKPLVLAAARELFLARGYDAVGMREIAAAVGRQPTQIYRLKLSKSDILAELIIELNALQIRQLPDLLAKCTGATLLERVSAYGWMWSQTYQEKIVGQG